MGRLLGGRGWGVGIPVESVEKRRQALADFLVVQAELGQAVAMLGLVALGAGFLGLEEGSVGGGHLHTQIGIDLFDRRLRGGGQLPVVDGGARHLGMAG
ncbi:MAG: hypothetical protein RBU25_19420, partial [Lentisphaeria bacterium]|nr:hypothetical protein [Lentisphaeria bacterium]